MSIKLFIQTACTIDVTYYPFDQQVCVVKVGTIDRTIQLDIYNKNEVDLSQFYMNGKVKKMFFLSLFKILSILPELISTISFLECD